MMVNWCECWGPPFFLPLFQLGKLLQSPSKLTIGWISLVNISVLSITSCLLQAASFSTKVLLYQIPEFKRKSLLSSLTVLIGIFNTHSALSSDEIPSIFASREPQMFIYSVRFYANSSSKAYANSWSRLFLIYFTASHSRKPYRDLTSMWTAHKLLAQVRRVLKYLWTIDWVL